MSQGTTNLLQLQLKLAMITIYGQYLVYSLQENTAFMPKLKNMVKFVNRPITWT